MTERSSTSARLGAAAAVLCVVAGLGFALAPASGQATADGSAESEPEAAPVMQPWSVTCAAPTGRAELVCAMQQSLLARATGKRMFSASISKGAGDGQPRMRLSLPHGVALPEGIELWIDSGKPTKVAIRTADQDGSYASIPLEPSLITAMKSGQTLNAAVTRDTGGRVVFQLSLAGFTAAFEKL